MEEATEQSKSNRQLEGIVVGLGAQSTVKVRVDRVRIHPKYKKRYTVSKNYACDYRKDDLSLGDTVSFEETRPLSKTKRWRIIKKV